jgi:hypothetical protein
MGAPRHSAEKRQTAIGALWASAVETDGEWKPNFSSVHKSHGVSISTLHRWWNGRDTKKDGKFKRQAEAGAAKAVELGSAQWIASMRRKLNERAQQILDNEEQWEKTGPDRAAKAIEFLTRNLDNLEGKTGGSVGRDDRVSKYKRAAEKAKVDP